MTMTQDIFEIPLSSGAQKFSIKLGDHALQIRLVWREAMGGGWFMDLFDNDDMELVSGIPLRCGQNVLEEHAHLGLGAMTVSLDGENTSDPSYGDMGSKVQLYWMAS